MGRAFVYALAALLGSQATRGRAEGRGDGFLREDVVALHRRVGPDGFNWRRLAAVLSFGSVGCVFDIFAFLRKTALPDSFH